MTRRAAVLAAALVAAAAGGPAAWAHPPPDDRIRVARDPEPPPKPRIPRRPSPPGSRKLGFRFGAGVTPLEGQVMSTIGLALGVERPLAGRWHWLAEYEHLWLLPRQTANARLRGESSFDGNAHRFHLGLRVTLAAKQLKQLRLFADGEVGGGATVAVYHGDVDPGPHAFAGVRLGYGLAPDRGSRGSQVWEPEIALRLIAVPNGLGFLGGLAMYWGD